MKSRKEFTKSQKAAIFCRDRATCAFTGKSLWILDHGATPFWDTDWIEHILPLSRGGKSVLENGLCASSAFNALRGNNTRGKTYFFRAGRVTELFCYTHAALQTEVREQFRRFARLQPSDWYFNRALKDVLIACNNRLNRVKATRTWSYWLNSAWNYLQDYQRLSVSTPSFEKRKLLRKPLEEHSKLLLRLRSAKSRSAADKIARKVYSHYDANCCLFHDFINEASKTRRKKLLSVARKKNRTSPSMIRLIAAMPSEVLPVVEI